MKGDMNAPYDVLDVSRFIINHSARAGHGISNLKLQKVLYLIQAHFLIKRDVPCFRERIEAWDFGPVVPEAYREFRSRGSTLIPFISSYVVFDRENIWNSRRARADEDVISEEDRRTIAEVTDFLSGFSATALGDLTRSQLPWMDAYVPGERNEMTCEAIRSYFAEKAETKAERKEQLGRFIPEEEDTRLNRRIHGRKRRIHDRLRLNCDERKETAHAECCRCIRNQEPFLHV